MGARWKVLAGLAGIAGLVLLGFVLARPAHKVGDAAAPTEPTASNPPAPVEPAPAMSSTEQAEPPLASARMPESSALGPAAAANLITNWEDRLDEILVAEGATDAKARQLLEMFPRLPPDGQAEVAKHLSNLVADQDYAPLGQLLADPRLPEDALATLMADVLNRPNAIKLPALLEVARAPQHPKAGEAKEVLGFLLETDYGDDWSKWQEKVQEWLKDNPD